jgi:hypothetical protein
MQPLDRHDADQRSGRPEHYRVDLSTALAADLASLSSALQDPDGSLEDRLALFADELRASFGSYLGLTITLAVDGHQISFSLTQRVAEAMTSLCIPLPEVAGSEPGSCLVLYAATPGAFVDLAADLAWTLGVDPAALVLDQHLAVPGSSNVVSGLQEHAVINQAIGVLIEDGHTPESGRTELRRRADLEDVALAVSAQQVLDGLVRPSSAAD